MSCREIDLDSWTGIIFANKQKYSRYPISATLELTERCNFNCVHCYINQPAACAEAKARELTTEQVKKLLDEIAAAGTLFLTLTGGEPLLRPDFAEIYMHARRLGMIVDLLTNGTLIDQNLIEILKKSKPNTVDISMYGATKETYEKVTRLPGSYDRFLRGVRLLKDADITMSLKSIALTLNVHEIGQMSQFAEELGAPFRYDGLLWPRIDGGKSPFEYQLPIEHVIEMDLEYPDRQEEWRKKGELFRNIPGRTEYVFVCGAGLRSYTIDCSGKMSMCSMARQPSFDIIEMGFEQAWQALGLLRQQKRVKSTPCTDCTAGIFCAQCPGWSQLVHGDNETQVKFVCDLGKARAKLFSPETLPILYEETVI